MVAIYGYRVSIHRLIQLIDLFLGGTAVSAGGGLQTGEFIVLGISLGPHHADRHPGMWGPGYTGLTLPWG